MDAAKSLLAYKDVVTRSNGNVSQEEDVLKDSSNVEQQSNAYILCLDDALMHRICRVLSLLDLLSFQCTCKDLNEFIVHNPHLWKRISIPRSLSEKLTDQHLMVLIQRAREELEVIEIHGSKNITGSFLLTDSMKKSTRLEKVLNIAKKAVSDIQLFLTTYFVYLPAALASRMP